MAGGWRFPSAGLPGGKGNAALSESSEEVGVAIAELVEVASVDGEKGASSFGEPWESPRGESWGLVGRARAQAMKPIKAAVGYFILTERNELAG